MDESHPKSVKVGVWEGGGPDPGYEWTVLFLSIAGNELFECFPEPGQQEHIADQIKDLAQHPDPTHSDTLDIERVETFFELKDKGGSLGPKANLRVYFDRVIKPYKAIRLLGVDNKKKMGPISIHMKDRVSRRQRLWNAQMYAMPLVQRKRKGGHL